MIYYLDQLASLCKQEPIQTKVVFVPSLQVGYHITTALASTGQPWANLHLTTPIDWVRQSTVPQVQAEGWTPLLPNYDLFFIAALVEETLEKEQATYFSNTTTRAELARAFLGTFQELRLAGVRPEDIGDGEAAKIRELSMCYRAYVEYLQTQKYYDDAYLFARAINDLSEAGDRPDATYALFDETLLSGLATRYINKLVDDQLFRIGRPHYGRPVPAQSAAARFPDAPMLETLISMSIGAGGRLLVGEGQDEDRERVRMVQVLGAEEEVRYIFRDILARTHRLDEVEIAYTTDGPYLSLLHGLSERLQVPMDFASGLPPERTRPGQALMGFVRWIISGFDIVEFGGLCQARLITFGRIEMEGERVPWSFEVASLLRSGRVRRGQRDYQLGLKRLSYELAQQKRENEAHGRATESLQSQIDLLEITSTIIEGLFDLLPSKQKVELKELTEACSTFLMQYAPIEGGYDQDARTGLTVHLRTIGEQVEISGSLQSLAGHLLELLSQHRVEAASAQPGRVFAVPLERAGYTHRPHVYILGMDEGSFPGRGIEDPVLLDDERQQLRLDLPLRRPRPGERVWQAERVLGMVPGKATLIARRTSLESGSEYYPSAFFQQLEKLVGISQATEAPSSFLPQTPADALDRMELMLVSRRSIGYDNAVWQVSPWLVNGREAARGRQGAELTRFDGRLQRATPELNPANGKVMLSASRLETLVRCPYHYFLKYLLHIDVPDEYEEDATSWLNPLDFGSLLHDLLCDFMQDLKDKDELPQTKHIPAMKQLLREKAEKKKETTPVTHEAAYRADIERLEQAVEIFLNVEARQENTQPIGFEVSFGFGREGELDSAEPVLLRLTKDIKLRLRGRIDRVDKVEGGYAIWDYKSGSAYSYREASLNRAGSYLQWALYAYVLDEILKREGREGHVVQSGYFFTTEREYGKRVAPPLPARHELGDRLQPLFELVSAGNFLHIQKEDHCTFCEFNRICATESITPKKWEGIEEEIGTQGDTEAKVGRWLHG